MIAAVDVRFGVDVRTIRRMFAAEFRFPRTFLSVQRSCDKDPIGVQAASSVITLVREIE
jgi:hypothetical protein